jgi:hypothetical protein
MLGTDAFLTGFVRLVELFPDLFLEQISFSVFSLKTLLEEKDLFFQFLQL